MRLHSLEPRNVEVLLDDPNFDLARIWTGRLADGTQVLLFVAGVVARDMGDAPRLEAARGALAPVELVLSSAEAAAFGDLANPSPAAQECAA